MARKPSATRFDMTDAKVRALKTDPDNAGQVDYWDTVRLGLCLRVSNGGRRKVWSVRYRNAEGRQRRAKLGEYPTMSLAEARDAAGEMIAEARKGEDPVAEREEAREAAALELEDRSFRRLANEVLESRAAKGKNGKPTREKTRRERRRIVGKELLPVWGDREAGSITRRDVVLLVDEIAKRAPVVANRTLSLIRLIFNDGLRRRGFPGLESNPAHLLEAPAAEEGRDRYLSRAEIAVVWKVTEHETVTARGAYRLALLTAQRIGSVERMRWDRIDAEGVWRIPAEDFKSDRDHLVPLSEEARAVIEELRQLRTDDVWVFPSRAGTKHPHVTNLSKALARIRDASGLPHWTAHDFRTTARTWLTRSEKDGGLGVSPDVADFGILGHKDPALGATRYQGDLVRYRLAEKRDALAKWGRFVREAVEAGKGGAT